MVTFCGELGCWLCGNESNIYNFNVDSEENTIEIMMAPYTVYETTKGDGRSLK
jgi:hypothetical protein